jgi:2-polyprenyl-6-methoxyphenol hydroxylase-like FAD-dependent oxidoreductase
MAEMQECRILDDVKKKSMINNILSYWVGAGPVKERIAYVEKLEGGQIFPAGINCGQAVLAETILEYLRREQKAEVLFNQKVIQLEQSESRVTVTCVDPRDDARTVYTCDWLVRADGAGSTIRRLLEIE